MNARLRALRPLVAMILAVLIASLTGSATAFARSKPEPPRTAQAGQTIAGSPLTVTVQNGLGMAVSYDGRQQFFGGDAGGTFLNVDGVVYGETPPANNGFNPLAFTPVSNSGPTGSGSEADPYRIVTVVEAGATGVRLTQTTSYVNGDVFYTVDVAVANTSSAARSVQIFHGADLYLNFPGNQADFGYGFYDEDSGAIGALSEDETIIQVFIPVTEPSARQEAYYATFWRQIGGAAGSPGPGFDNTYNQSYHDTAAGLQYNRSIAAGGNTAVSFLGAFGAIADVPIDGPGEEDIITSPPAFVTVVNHPTPNIRATRGAIISYAIEITNRGEGRARNVTVEVPFNPSEVTVLDVTFANSSTAWVSELGSDSLTIQTGNIPGDGSVMTATLRVRVNDNVANGTGLGERLSFSWDDSDDGGEGATNLTLLTVGDSAINVPVYSFTVEPASAPLDTVRTFATAIFAPSEPVALWINTPANENIPINEVDGGDDQFEADSEGAISIDLSLSDLPAGTYSVVAYGTWSRFTATGVFVIQ